MKNILLFFFTLAIVQLFAQTSNVKGIVTDQLSQKPVAGATVTILGTNFTATTDAQGNYVIKNVPFGNYTVEIKEANHASYTQALPVNTPETIVGSVGLQIPESRVKAEENSELPTDIVTESATLSANDLTNIGGQIEGGSTIGYIYKDPFLADVLYNLSPEGRFEIRGERPDFTTIYMNGIPQNDPQYYGNVAWGSFGNIIDLYRSNNYTLGMAPSDEAFGGAGGSEMFDSRASTHRAGFEVRYTTADGQWRDRLMARYATGIMKGGWAIAASVQGRWAQQGYIPGTFYEGYSYYASIDKKFGNKNTLSLTTYGAPTRNGRSLATTQEAYDLAGSNYYNPGWGYQNGQVRNAYVVNNFHPAFILNDQWKLNDKSSLMLAAGYSFGKYQSSGLDWNNAADPLPDYYEALPSYVLDSAQKALAQENFRNNINARQINWDNLYNANYHSYDSIPNLNGSGKTGYVNDSKYIIGNRVEAQKKFDFNAIYNTLFNSHVSLTAGLSYQFERTENYKEVADLLGGSGYMNYNQYPPLQYAGNDSVNQNNLLQPNQMVGAGGKYDYDYFMTNHYSQLWLQPKFHFGKLDFFVAGNVSTTAFWRTGVFQNGLYPTSSLGPSTTEMFLDYGIKGGLSFKFDKRSALYAYGAAYTQAPYGNDVFTSAQTRNQLVANIQNEEVYAAELGYTYTSPIVKARATLYYTQTNNEIETRSFYDDNLYTYVNYSLTGINSQRIGGEGAMEVKIYKGFSASLVANIGRNTYTSNPVATITDDNTAQYLPNQTVYFKGLNLPNTPQMVYSFGLHYTSPQYWYIHAYIHYYDWMWAQLSPAQRTSDALVGLEPNTPAWDAVMNQPQMNPNGAIMVDLTAGYSWRLNNEFKGIKSKHSYYLSFWLRASNLTNNTSYVNYESEQLRFDNLNQTPNTYPPRLTYAYGTTYSLTVAFRMQ